MLEGLEKEARERRKGLWADPQPGGARIAEWALTRLLSPCICPINPGTHFLLCETPSRFSQVPNCSE